MDALQFAKRVQNNELDLSDVEVECRWTKDRRLLINPDGQVLPCCYLANTHYAHNAMGEPEKTEMNSSIDGALREKWERGVEKETEPIRNIVVDMEYYSTCVWNQEVTSEYIENQDEYNIFKTPLEDIVNSEWFTKTLPESWTDPKRIVWQCYKFCSKKK